MPLVPLSGCAIHQMVLLQEEMQCCYAGCECSTSILQLQSTQPEVVAKFVMDTEIALEEND